MSQREQSIQSKGVGGKCSLLLSPIPMPFHAPDPAKLLLLTNWVGLFNPFLVKRWNTPTRVWFESSHEYYTRKIRSKSLQNFMVWGNCQQVFTRTIFLFALKECFTLCLLNRGNLWYYHLAYYHFNPRLDSKKKAECHFSHNHNCNKILKSDWLSTVLISAWIGLHSVLLPLLFFC